MTEGELWRDRWRLTGRAPSRDALERWHAEDTSTGQSVEILILRPSRGNRDSRRDFVNVHRALRTASDPALRETLEVHHDGELAFAVRAPLHTQTVADVRGPLPADQVAAIGAKLLPAVLAAGSATRGALLPSDVGLDDVGQPVLALRGAPLTQVVRGTTRAAAPEAFQGADPDGPAGLYGLGVLLYQLATGRSPQAAGLGPTAQPPPPSAVRHGIPQALDTAITTLLSTDPSRRAAALPWLLDAAGPLPDLRTQLQQAAASEPVRTGPANDASRRQHADDDVPAGLVLVDAGDLAQLEPAQRSHAAGLAGVPLSVVHDLITARLPLVVATTTSRAGAVQQAQRLSRDSGLPVAAGVRSGVSPWAVGATTAVAASVPALLVLLTAALGAWFLAVPLLLLLATIGLAGAWIGLATQRRRALHGAGLAGLRHARGRRGDHAVDLLAPAWDQLARVRAQLGAADLPTNANTDVRSVLKDLEERLLGLATRAGASERALKQVDATQLRTRLAALTTQQELSDAQRAERDRLARTVSDLDAVAEHRRSVASEAARIRDALAEITAVLGQLGDDPGEALLDGLGRATRHAATAASDPPSGTATDRARAEAARRAQRAHPEREGR